MVLHLRTRAKNASVRWVATPPGLDYAARARQPSLNRPRDEGDGDGHRGAAEGHDDDAERASERASEDDRDTIIPCLWGVTTSPLRSDMDVDDDSGPDLMTLVPGRANVTGGGDGGGNGRKKRKKKLTKRGGKKKRMTGNQEDAERLKKTNGDE